MNIPVLEKIKSLILEPFIAFLMALAIIYFLFGLYKFISGFDNQTARDEGKKHMLWGVVGVAIMTSVYGLITIISSTISGLVVP